jgi:leucyl-tRNA synthetase
MKPYNPAELEPKWQNYWLEKKLFEASAESNKKKFYTLVEFPYPSGDGLHVGHVRSYTALDIIARKRRAEGFNVLYPMGWDAFGLPTENYAIKTGIKPTIVTKQNSDTFRRQLQAGGFSFDWSREINTTDPKYYKWTQWIFLQLYKHGLAYKAKQAINWCPKDKIGLANEEVIDGKCERCGTPVEQREKEQWLLAITKYADRLDKDLDTVDYLERIKIQQRNWIGKSEGAIIKFDEVEVFTTRPETIFGATFIAVAGKVDRDTGKKVTNPATGEQIPVWEAEYVMDGVGTGAVMGVPAHDERDYAFATKHNLPIKPVIMPSLVDTTNPPQEGKENTKRETVLAIVYNPKTDKYLTLKWKQRAWVTFPMGGKEAGEDAVTAAKRELQEETGYTNLKLVRSLGVIEAFFFAAHKNVNRQIHGEHLLFELVDDTRVAVAESEEGQYEVQWLLPKELRAAKVQHVEFETLWERINAGNNVYTGHGVLINSGDLSGKKSEEVKDQVIKLVNGKPVTTYKLRDWVFSRQRYWGEPIPMIDCPKCGWQPVPEEQLPVTLPDVERYEPTDTGESPLAKVTNWVNTTCPKCDGVAKRETDTMPNWAGSSWYYLAYAVIQKANGKGQNYNLKDKQALDHWIPVDWYNGGMEHTTLHLLYSRFWHKFLFDIGVVPTSEPYAKRTSHGIILAGSFSAST